MAQNFDEFPLDDKLVKQGGQLSDIWRGSMSTFYQSLVEYLTPKWNIRPQDNGSAKNADSGTTRRSIDICNRCGSRTSSVP